jgi:hypothetical protein
MQVAPLEVIAKAINDPEGTFLCTDYFHEGLTCNQKALQQFAATVQSCSKMYFMVHIIPFLLFKRKKVKQKYTF